jgi:hypothetical protein
MKVELTADFDLGKVTEVHQVARSAEVSPETSSGRELALIRELKALDCEVTDAPEASPEELRLSPEANVPLETSDEGELCLDFAPALTARVPKDDPQWESGDLPCFAPMIDSVRVDLRDFEAGLPFERRLTVEQEQLIIELKLAFRPL